MKLDQKLENIVVQLGTTTHKLADHVRKTYAVEERRNGGEWTQVGTFNNSTDAGAEAEHVMPDLGEEGLARSEVRPALDAVLHFWRTGEGEHPKRHNI